MLHWKAANSSSSILAFIFHVAMVFLLGFTHLFGISQLVQLAGQVRLDWKHGCCQ